MKKLSYLIVLALILGLVLTGCTFLSNIGQAPATEQSGISYIVKNAVVPPINAFRTDLLAGQTLDVGDVLVWNDAENLYVEFVYEGSECGFLEVHLQVDEGSFSLDILTKKGNPIPGQFENSYDVGCFTEKRFTYNLADEGFDCDDGLVIAAHAVVPSGGANIGNLNGPVYAANVFSVTPGTGSVRDPLTALGAPDSSYGVESFYSLGFGGCIELEFADFVGGTLTVYETTWHHFDGDTYPKESANIYVSADGSDWTYLGEANNDGQSWSNTPIPNVFTLEECIKYVRICDTTDQSAFGSGANAFDLDAVEAQYFCEKETAWGAEELGEIPFPGKNWATYFTYEIACEELIDTVEVSSGGSSVCSVTLVSGQEYRLEASGTFEYNTAGDWADAEWYLKSGVIVKGDTEGSKPYVLDVSIDGYSVNTDWGDYSGDHIYSIPFTGTGSPICFSIYDSNYGDNSGSLTVDIYLVP